MIRRFPILLLTAVLLGGCLTVSTVPEFNDYIPPSGKYLTDAERENLLSWQAPEIEILQKPEIPEGYWKSGFTNFSGQDDVEENIAGLLDPHVYEAEIYLDWRTVEPEEGVFNWKPIDDQIALWAAYGKKVAIRVVTASHNTLETPRWLHEVYHVRKITKGIWTDFESTEKSFSPLGKTVVTKKRDDSISGIRSAYSEYKGDMLELREGKVSGNRFYAVQFDYASPSGGRYYAAAVSREGGPEATRFMTWDAAAGESGSRFWSVITGPWQDYRIVWGIEEGDSLLLDNLLVYEQAYGIGRTVGYPDYFNPVYHEKWGNFVEALGERYAHNPHVETVCVSGHGRYGELGIEGDRAGHHDPQWMAIGFTQEKYMDIVEGNIKLFKKHFPDKILRMVAGGTVLPGWTDENYIYYRGINTCAEYGVQFKINGMQEAFGVWGTNAFSYGANRYKHNSDTSISIETAGQIYRNDTGKPTVPTGHAISTLNRVLIDGMDNMYLYSHDAMADSVRKYLPYMAGQMGSEQLTRFYCRPGMYRESNSVAEVLQEYKDVWLGIFRKQYPDDAGLPLQYGELLTHNGEHAVRSGNSVLDFELDARQRYNGLYGTTITVVYLDEGTDSFTVQVNDSVDELKLRTLETITKTGTGEWKTLSLYDSAWSASYRNFGKDMGTNIVIDDNGDGPETLRLIEVAAVPALEWNRSPVAENPVLPEDILLLEGGERWDITVPVDIPATMLTLPIYQDNSHKKNFIRFKLFRNTERGEELIADRELYYARDGLDLHLPLDGTVLSGTYILEVAETEGVIGVYGGEDGTPAWTAWRYETLPGAEQTPVPGKAGTEEALVFDADSPFYMIQLQGAVSGNSYRIEKRMAGSGQWTPVSSAVQAVSLDGKTVLPFEPQTAGEYRILGESGAIRNIRSLSPGNLIRLTEAKGVVYQPVGESLILWNADEISRSWSLSSLEKGGAGRNALELKVRGTEPAVTSPRLDLKARRNQFISFSLINGTDSSMARVFWKGPGQDFHAERSMLLPVIPNDPRLRSYDYPLGDHPLWTGDISEIKVMFADGGTNRGQLSLKSVEIRERTTLYNARFDGPADRMFHIATRKPAEIRDGKLYITEPFASLSTVMTMPDFQAEPGQVIEVRVKNSSDAGYLDIGWAAADWMEGLYSYDSYYLSAEMDAYDSEYRVFRFSPEADDGWKGRINRIFLKFDNMDTDKPVLVDSIRIYREKE
ncbi:MAG: hypothetical protein PQJ58_08880 [Spirochaetales bacterium]|nr:hypothetical protein [Spirochaetales bacterium]